MKFTRKLHQGFTLIELMIVVAIIGILAAIAIPAYQNYTIRAQVTEGLTLADGWKTAIAEFYANTGNWPVVANLTGTNVSVGKYESSVTVIAGGVISITYGGTAVNKNVSGSVLDLIPWTNANHDVLWQCGSSPQPGSASTVATGATATTASTTVSPQYLPTSCHS
jgi:type IV pilus assembly protein PilA